MKKIITLSITLLLLGSVTNVIAQKQRTQDFYIQHETSENYVAPFNKEYIKGAALVLVDISLYTDKVNSAGLFYLEYAGKGDWGYLVSARSPNLTVHPVGSSINCGNGSKLIFWEGKSIGSLFRFDQQSNTIQHKSERYWHPSGGSDLAGHGTDLEIWDSFNGSTKFIPVDRYGKRMDLLLPITTSTIWEKVFSDTNTTTTTQPNSYTYTIGTVTSNSTTKENESTLSASLESSILGVNASASAEVRNLYSSSKSNENNVSNSSTKNYTLEPGESIYVWQKVLTVKWSDNRTASMSTYETRSTSTPVAPKN